MLDSFAIYAAPCSDTSPHLPEHGVAARHGDGGVPAVDRHGEVEGGDDAHHAQRVPVLQQRVPRPLTGDNLRIIMLLLK